jgi:hypothetical protein
VRPIANRDSTKTWEDWGKFRTNKLERGEYRKLWTSVNTKQMICYENRTRMRTVAPGSSVMGAYLSHSLWVVYPLQQTRETSRGFCVCGRPASKIATGKHAASQSTSKREHRPLRNGKCPARSILDTPLCRMNPAPWRVYFPLDSTLIPTDNPDHPHCDVRAWSTHSSQDPAEPYAEGPNEHSRNYGHPSHVYMCQCQGSSRFLCCLGSQSVR